jgi:phage gp36-like protein
VDVAITWTYCTAEDVENFFGATGVAAFASHDLRGSEATVDDCIAQATDEINLYVLRRYDEAGVKTSRMLRQWCVVMATVYLCERRGNPVPESLVAEYQRIAEKLPLIMRDEMRIPGVPLKGLNVPMFSNMHIDRRYVRRQQRVAINSTNMPKQRPQDSELTQFDY